VLSSLPTRRSAAPAARPAGPRQRRQGAGDPGARHHLTVRRRQVARPRLKPAGRALLAALSRALPKPRQRGHLIVPRPVCLAHRTKSHHRLDGIRRLRRDRAEPIRGAARRPHRPHPASSSGGPGSLSSPCRKNTVSASRSPTRSRTPRPSPQLAGKQQDDNRASQPQPPRPCAIAGALVASGGPAWPWMVRTVRAPRAGPQGGHRAPQRPTPPPDAAP
jgi:hypothetical protein